MKDNQLAFAKITRRIAQTPQFIWAKTFEYTLDEKIKDAIGKLVDEKRTKSRYNAYAVDDQLNQISSLLEKCLVYRRDYQDLEALAIKQGLAYELFTDQLANARDSDTAAWIKTGVSNRKRGYATVAQSFASADHLSSGFVSWMKEYEASAGDDEVAENTRIGLVDAKWTRLARYQQDLNDLHTQPGGSLHYGDRANRVYALLLEDLTEAYVRSEAALAGLKQVFELKVPDLPALIENMLLDKLFDWARECVDEYNIDQENYTDTELVIPVRDHGLTSPVTVGGKTAVIDEKTWGFNLDTPTPGSGYGPAIYTFEINIPGTIQSAHLRGIGASFYIPAEHLKTQDWRGIRGGVVVFPPHAADLSGGQHGFDSTPVLLDNVAVTDPYVPVRIKYGGNFTNVNPAGVWSLKISKLLGLPSEDGAAQLPRTKDVIQNLCLHLRISCKLPSSDPNQWRDLAW